MDALTPIIRWADSKTKVFLTIELSDTKVGRPRSTLFHMLFNDLQQRDRDVSDVSGILKENIKLLSA